jgi:hypothetical protein
MAVQRALVFRAGSMGLICAAYEVEIEGGGQDRKGTMRAIRDCTNLATELWTAGGTYTRLCAPCRDAIADSPDVGVVRTQQRPGTN